MNDRRKQLMMGLGACLLLALVGLGLMGFGGSQSVGDVGFFGFLGGAGVGLVLALLLALDVLRSRRAGEFSN
jgi:hypothetical protein